MADEEHDENGAPAAHDGWLLARKAWMFLGALLALCLLAGGLAAQESNSGFASNAALLTFVGAVAIAIERVIELVWTLVGHSRLSAWWPLKDVRQAFEQVEEETNKRLLPVFKETQTLLQEAMEASKGSQETLAKLGQMTDRLTTQQERFKHRLGDAERLAPNSARLALVTRVSREADTLLRDAETLAREAGAKGKTALDDVRAATERAVDIVDSFDDNPARRVASLVIGASLGVLVAGFMSLNIFAAVLGPPTGAAADAGLLSGTVGILLTGIVLGFGANPTHEVVKALQRYKNRSGREEVLPLPKASSGGALAVAGVRLVDLASYEAASTPSSVMPASAGEARTTRIRSAR